MIGSLRIMNFGFLISVMVAVLIIGRSLDASAQTQGVECPCNYEKVPKDKACWTEPFSSQPGYKEVGTPEGAVFCELRQPVTNAIIELAVFDATQSKPAESSTCTVQLPAENGGECGPQTQKVEPLTPEEVKACQCELLAYVTALNEVDGIMVSGGPPYDCIDVNCTVVLTPIPTLNEYGMIITAGVLGLLAVIGLFVMRRRKVSA